jgi:hypothetical protein
MRRRSQRTCGQGERWRREVHHHRRSSPPLGKKGEWLISARDTTEVENGGEAKTIAAEAAQQAPSLHETRMNRIAAFAKLIGRVSVHVFFTA